MSEQLIFSSFADDMTFYAWMGLMQLQNGTTNANSLSQALTGSISSGLRTDFPSNLSFFCQQTSNVYGNESVIARYHTTLPYFTTFKEEKYLRTSISLMSSNSVETLKFHLGLTPSNLNGYVPLKFCPACYINDISIHGFAYWHRKHQLPTSYACPKHGETLQFQALREDGCGRSLLVLPNDQHSQKISLPENAKPILLRLSLLSEKILQLTLPSSFNDMQLLHTYRHGLKEQGFLTRRGLIRASEFLGKFQNYYSSIKSVQPYSEILKKHKIANLLKLLRKPRGNHHTAEHIIMIDFLFGSWELFASTYQWESQFQLDLHKDRSNIFIPLESKVSTEINEIVSRYENGESLSSLCREKNSDIGTVMRKINKHGLTQIKKRPKTLTNEKIDEVVTLLKKGKSISDITKETNLSKSTIDRICSEKQDAKAAWKLAKIKRMRYERRQLLNDYLSMHQSVTTREIRTILPKEYKWLSTHDPDWLNNYVKKLNRQHIKRTSVIAKPRVDWGQRDQECLYALKSIVGLNLESWERIKPQLFLRRLNLPFKPDLNRLPISKEWVTNELEKIKNEKK